MPSEMIKGSIYKLFPSASTRLASSSARHGELRFLPHWVCATSSWGVLTALLASQVTSLAMASKHELLPIFSFGNSPWRVECELVARKHASLPIFPFVNSPWRVELLGRRENMLFCLFWPCCTLFPVFHLCSVP